jgi:hypothetical protein
MAGEGGAGAEWALRVEDKVLWLLPYKESIVFFFLLLNFPFVFSFSGFCRVLNFEFLNYVFTKNLEIDSSFFRIFYFNCF